MRKYFSCITFLIILTNCSQTESEIPEIKTSIDQTTNKSTRDSIDFKKFVGKYAKDSVFFENPIVKSELKRILGDDLNKYLDHVSKSGSGEINFKYGLLYGDISQLHVGGYTSLFFFNIKDNKMYLFWLTETVSEKKYKIYGDMPIPASVLNLIDQEMNIAWGHVAIFKIKGDKIDIDLK